MSPPPHLNQTEVWAFSWTTIVFTPDSSVDSVRLGTNIETFVTSSAGAVCFHTTMCQSQAKSITKPFTHPFTCGGMPPGTTEENDSKPSEDTEHNFVLHKT